MRLKSAHFVSALIRAEAAEGAFCAILNKGAADAGAIFIVHVQGQSHELLAPVPQMFIEDDQRAERLFERRLMTVDTSEISAAIERELNFDPDCWVVEVEKSGALAFVTIVETD